MFTMPKTECSVCFLVFVALAASLVVAGEPIKFESHRIGSFRSEACCVADFTGDGRLDIVAGPFVYVAPDWRPWKIRNLKGEVDEQGNGYYRDFANLSIDVDGDGRLDIVSCDWFDKCIVWYRNTGSEGPLWPRTVIEISTNYESADLVDIDGDGRAEEILAHLASTVWYERVDKAEGGSRVVKHVVSEKPCDFGGGVGDINCDGRPDILRPNAWYEAPADLRTGRWIEHPLAIGNIEEGKAEHTPQILVCDVDADGLKDIITSSAHRYGIFWYQQVLTAGQTTWKQHIIDDTWSQAHSLTLADLNGDGTPDLVTGKRHLAHNGKDPGSGEPLGVYWYELQRGPNPEWTRHVISRSEGIGSGLNIPVVDIDGDGDLDIVVTGKFGGPVLFENKTKNSAPNE